MRSFLIFILTASALSAQNEATQTHHRYWITAGGPYLNNYQNRHIHTFVAMTGEGNYAFNDNVVTLSYTFVANIGVTEDAKIWQLTAGKRYEKKPFYLQGSVGLARVQARYEDNDENLHRYVRPGLVLKTEIGLYVWKYLAVTAQASGILTKKGWDRAGFIGLSIGNFQ